MITPAGYLSCLEEYINATTDRFPDSELLTPPKNQHSTGSLHIEYERVCTSNLI